jgi:hypothetical protein
MTPSYAQARGEPSDFIIQLVPMLFIWALIFIFGYFIGRRKGVSTSGIIIGTIPLWGFIVLLWWASLTDKDVLDRLNRLEGR